MRKMRKILLFSILLFLHNTTIKAQSILPNYNFESGQSGQLPWCIEATVGLFDDRISDWKAIMSNFHQTSTPDWMTSGTCDGGGPGWVIVNNWIPNRYIHFALDEGVKVNTSTFIEDQKYVLRYKVASTSDVNYNFYISRYFDFPGWRFDKQNIAHGNFSTLSNYWQSYYSTFKPDNDIYDVFVIAGENDNGDPIFLDDILVYEYCLENMLIENTFYVSSEYPYEAKNITAGYSVDPSQTDGNVIVKNGAVITYKAEQEVNLEPGFEVENGGEFEAYIAPCGSLCPPLPTVYAGDDINICDDNSYQIGMSGNYSLNYLWTAEPTAAILYLSSSSIPNPVFTAPINSCGFVKYNLMVSNDCYESASDAVIIKYNTNQTTTTPSVNPAITGTTDDCNLSMNIDIDACIDKVFIEIWNWALTSKLYSYELNSGTDFNCCNFDWTMPDYLTKCDNYKVKIYSQSICDSQLSNVVVLDWLRNSVISVVQAPNVFTPNNDGQNDQFCFIVNGAESYTIQIWDPYIQAYVCNSSGSGCENFCVWDGYHNGVLCPDRVYYYVATFSNSCQNTVSINGTVELLSHSAKLSDTTNTSGKDTTSVSDIKQDNQENADYSFALFPNPNNGNMTVAYELPDNETGTFELYDVIGKKLLSYQLYSGKNTFSISDDKVKKGIYFYKAFSSIKQIAADKIVVIK